MPDQHLSPEEIEQAALLFDAMRGGGTVLAEPGEVVGFPDDDTLTALVTDDEDEE